MCSILCTNKPVKNAEEINYYLKFRGPDETNVLKDKTNGFTFLHNLLSITGEVSPQPFVQNGVVCVYNGEIYNYQEFGGYGSDGECLIDLYKTYGVEFVKRLDGEFVLVLLDFNKDLSVIATDPFKTKPLFYSVENGEFGCATYKTPLETIGHQNVMKAIPNTAIVFRLSDSTLLDKFTICEFDLTQFKTNFDDWNLAFQNAITKRAYNCREKIFIGLSSGYDSGVISAELLRQQIPFKAITVMGNTENEKVLSARHAAIEKSGISTVQTLQKSNEFRFAHQATIEEMTEEFIWTIESSRNNYKERWKLTDDRGSIWLSGVCNAAKQDGRKIYISGQGADEIFADYGHAGKPKTSHSNFGGLFPENLEDVFPWPSFYYSSQESYIAKEEYVSGAYGIEARYPFLDKQVVQEFLWLDHKLKNSQYKSVLANYYTIHQLPYSQNQKVGF